MSQKLPLNYFKWVKDTSEFNEDFIKSCDDENDEGYFLEVDVLKIYITFTMINHFNLKE